MKVVIRTRRLPITNEADAISYMKDIIALNRSNMSTAGSTYSLDKDLYVRRQKEAIRSRYQWEKSYEISDLKELAPILSGLSGEGAKASNGTVLDCRTLLVSKPGEEPYLLVVESMSKEVVEALKHRGVSPYGFDADSTTFPYMDGASDRRTKASRRYQNTETVESLLEWWTT